MLYIKIVDSVQWSNDSMLLDLFDKNVLYLMLKSFATSGASWSMVRLMLSDVVLSRDAKIPEP